MALNTLGFGETDKVVDYKFCIYGALCWIPIVMTPRTQSVVDLVFLLTSKVTFIVLEPSLSNRDP